jgi:hypothetical protein
LDEVKLERLREELSQEIEAPYKDIVRQLENELQNLQQQLTKLKYDNNFQKTTNERERTEHHNFIEQLRVKHDIELTALKRDRDSLRLKLQENNQSEIAKIKDVIRENNQYKIKVKSLIEENEELREKIDNLETHNNALIRNQSKIVSDYTTKIAMLEVSISFELDSFW